MLDLACVKRRGPASLRRVRRCVVVLEVPAPSVLGAPALTALAASPTIGAVGRLRRHGLAALGALLALVAGPGPLALAQLAPGPGVAARESVPARFVYREGPRTRVVAREADGSLWLEVDGRRVPTALGTDRVIVIGEEASLEGLEVEVDQVLSRGARILAVRSRRSEEGALALASRLSAAVAAGRLESAAPDLAFEHVAADVDVPPNDPDYGSQWFYDTIGIEAAWAREDGDERVTIAVVDNGCDERHRDLVGHVRAGYDAFDEDGDPSPLPDDYGNHHGTACAGLAAASTDNGLDVAGACPECSLRCIRLLGGNGDPSPMSADVLAFDFVLRHDDVAVVSNSWGLPPGVPAPLALVRVIEQVQTRGRGGLGAVVVFAAGNDDVEIRSDEIAAIPGVIAVGATDAMEEIRSYSNHGEVLAVAAPTGEVTTDITGADGADPSGVTTSFGGTSSACPIVAGVLGLLASASPGSTAEELRAALVSTARQPSAARPDASGHDPDFGFGMIDPRAALDAIAPPPDAGVDLDAAVIEIDARWVPRDVGPRARPPTNACNCRVGRASAAPWPLLVLACVLARRRARRASRPERGQSSSGRTSR